MDALATKTRKLPRTATVDSMQREAAEEVSKTSAAFKKALDRAYNMGLVVNLHISGSEAGEETTLVPDMQLRDLQTATYQELGNGS
jgi:hypothetical protein